MEGLPMEGQKLMERAMTIIHMEVLPMFEHKSMSVFLMRYSHGRISHEEITRPERTRAYTNRL